MTKLKPCPFCGGKAKIHSAVTSGILKCPKAYCYCDKCLATTQSFEDYEYNGEYIFKAINAWNRRAGNV